MSQISVFTKNVMHIEVRYVAQVVSETQREGYHISMYSLIFKSKFYV